VELSRLKQEYGEAGAKAAASNQVAREDLARAKTEINQWKKKSESLAKELKTALANQGNRVGTISENNDINVHKSRIQELEQKIEVGVIFVIASPQRGSLVLCLPIKATWLYSL